MTETRSLTEEFWTIVSRYEILWQSLTMITTVMIVLSAMVLPFVRPGTDSYYVSVINLSLLVPLLMVSVYVNLKIRSSE